MTPNDLPRGFRITRRRVLAGIGGALTPFSLAGAMPSTGAAQEASPGATPTGAPSPEVITSVQYQHPEKVYFYIPGFQDEAFLAAMYGIDIETYRAIRAEFDTAAHDAAMELLADEAFAAKVDALPFDPGSVVTAIGESDTDDLQSWFEILRHLVTMQRPDDGTQFVNAGISGQTTDDALNMIVQTVGQEPSWVFCMLGANDSWRIGVDPAKTLVSIEESEKNLAEMRHQVTAQTDASWVWLARPPIDDARVAAFPAFSMGGFVMRQADIARFNAFVLDQPESVVDIPAAFGDPAGSDLLGPDGLHATLAGQAEIARAVADTLAA
jgi:lysophospholipase L1-like esterase